MYIEESCLFTLQTQTFLDFIGILGKDQHIVAHIISRWKGEDAHFFHCFTYANLKSVVCPSNLIHCRTQFWYNYRSKWCLFLLSTSDWDFYPFCSFSQFTLKSQHSSFAKYSQLDSNLDYPGTWISFDLNHRTAALAICLVFFSCCSVNLASVTSVLHPSTGFLLGLSVIRWY